MGSAPISGSGAAVLHPQDVAGLASQAVPAVSLSSCEKGESKQLEEKADSSCPSQAKEKKRPLANQSAEGEAKRQRTEGSAQYRLLAPLPPLPPLPPLMDLIWKFR